MTTLLGNLSVSEGERESDIRTGDIFGIVMIPVIVIDLSQW